MDLFRRNVTIAALGAAIPLTGVAGMPAASVVDETWTDAARQREIPVRLRWPDGGQHSGPRPIVLFSHGLGGTRDGGSLWGEAWSNAGFVVLHLQHHGSDLAAVRGTASSFTDRAGLRTAATAQQLLARLRDVGFVLEEITRRHQARQERWAAVRPTRIGMSGHSFGAHTTLGMAGQTYPGFTGVDEPRLASFIAFSPTLPPTGGPTQAFSRLTRPLLSITGTRDSDVLGTGATAERRIAVFGALPMGDKGHLVLQDADHMTFAGQTGRAVEIVAREQITLDLQPSHHALIGSVTTDWWRATLQGDAASRTRLTAPQGLRTGDLWELK
ncbi:MAG: hypothetical protein LH632_00165 [Rhodoferax sp.]|nr:hypothetical protein [Rhodoferax sp.]